MRNYTILFIIFIITHTIPAQAGPPPVPHLHWQSTDNHSGVDIGGALRSNYRYEDWNTSNNRNPPHLRFDTFRVDSSGYYNNLSFDSGFWFQENHKYAIDRTFIAWHVTQQQQVQLGAPYKPFGLMPYPQFGWSYHIPFFLGFAVNSGLGARYRYQDADWTLDAAWFPEMLPPGVRYAPDTGYYGELKNTLYGPHHRQFNEKRDQLNLRLARTVKSGRWNNEFGASLAAARLVNHSSGGNGTFWAAGAHTMLNIDDWHLTSQLIRYQYAPKDPPGSDRSTILMGGNGLTPAYLIPAKATTASLNLARDLGVRWGPVSKLRFYTDYSVLWKDKKGWSDSQMETLGVQLFALPVMFWLDFTWSTNANPWGGALNATGWTSTRSAGSDKWYFRSNLNMGYYF